MSYARRLRHVDPTVGVVLAVSLLLAAMALQQYLGGEYAGAVILAVGSIVASLFATVAPWK